MPDCFVSRIADFLRALRSGDARFARSRRFFFIVYAFCIDVKMAAAKRLVPLLNRIVVEKVAAPTKTVGGIMLPESAVSKVRRFAFLPCACLHPVVHSGYT